MDVRAQMNPEARTTPPIPLAAREVTQLIEAVLFIGSEPVTVAKLTEAFPENSADDFIGVLRMLADKYREQRRPYLIRRTEQGYSLVVARRFTDQLASRSRTERGAKLNRQAIEVLSVVAYRQPISREEAREQVGYDPGAVLRQLARRDLIGLDPKSALDEGAKVYVTTTRFLEAFGLESLEDLPTSEDLQKL